ncbi:hypothetical protein ACFX5E_16165 [Flavobacterium sp. LS2P90]|uniref:Uncharacterized protein n=1 Tax=Flavobacterium xylosi TaxID=3230415 RepID=A0ABW6I1D3_9FLAO
MRNRNTENNMVEINNFGIPPEFPDGETKTKERFIEFVLKKAPKINSFCIHKIVDKLELNEIEKKQFKHLNLDIRSDLVNSKLAEIAVKGGTDIRLTETGRNYFDKKHSDTIIAENFIIGDNYGIQSSKSDFTAPITINAKQNPSINPEIKSSVQKFFSNPWVLLISGIAIEEVTIGKIYKFIISIV